MNNTENTIPGADVHGVVETDVMPDGTVVQEADVSVDTSATDAAVTAKVDAAVGAAADVAIDVEAAADVALDQLRKEVDHWKDYARRAQAEFENTRKRLAQTHADEVKRAGVRVVSALIPVIDDIELAMAHAQETENEMAEGLVAIHTKFMSALEREGVEVFDPKGEPYDMETAQAVGMVPSAEVPEHNVVDVMQKGYRLGGKTLRPAMVTVSTGA